MSTENKTEQDSVHQLAASVQDVVSSMFGVGAAVLKTIAEATAAGQGLPPVTKGQGPLAEMVQYSAMAFANVIRLAVSSTGLVATGAGVAPKTPAATGATATAHPQVHAGATLRIPLSIENPLDQPMNQLIFEVAGMKALQSSPGEVMGMSAVRLEPATLSIAPRDFEKLTVFVETTPTTATGFYELALKAAAAGLETAVRFEVVPVAS